MIYCIASYAENDFPLLRSKIRELHPVQRASLEALLRHYLRVTCHSDKNEMTVDKLAASTYGVFHGNVVFQDSVNAKACCTNVLYFCKLIPQRNWLWKISFTTYIPFSKSALLHPQLFLHPMMCLRQCLQTLTTRYFRLPTYHTTLRFQPWHIVHPRRCQPLQRPLGALSLNGTCISRDEPHIQMHRRYRQAHLRACCRVCQIFHSLLLRACKLGWGDSPRDILFCNLYHGFMGYLYFWKRHYDWHLKPRV